MDVVRLASGLTHRYEFWAVTDLIYTLIYCVISVQGDRMPYMYDFEQWQMFWGHSYSLHNWQFWMVPVLGAFWLFIVSVFVSSVLSFLKYKAVRYVVFFQTPLRFFVLSVLVTLAIASETTGSRVGCGLIAILFFSIEVGRVSAFWRSSVR